MYHGREAKACATFESAADEEAVTGKALRPVGASRGASPLHMARHLSINAVSLRLASSARSYIALAASKSRLDAASRAGSADLWTISWAFLICWEQDFLCFLHFETSNTIQHLIDKRSLRHKKEVWFNLNSFQLRDIIPLETILQRRDRSGCHPGVEREALHKFL